MSLDTTQEELDQLARALASVDMGRINDLKGVFDDIMAPYPTILGKAASKKEREEMKLKKQTLTYGYFGVYFIPLISTFSLSIIGYSSSLLFFFFFLFLRTFFFCPFFNLLQRDKFRQLCHSYGQDQESLWQARSGS